MCQEERTRCGQEHLEYNNHSNSDFAKLTKAVVAIYIRHSLLCNLNPNDLESALYDAAREIRGKHSTNTKSSSSLSAAKAILKKINPTDDAVCAGAEELYLRKSEATWLMTRLANAMQSKTKEIGMDKANLEHIFPQNPGAAWTNKQSLETHLWHIGNLTILERRINRKAKNKGFKDKCREHYSKSEIAMTREICKVQSWDEAAILKRAKSLGKRSPKCGNSPMPAITRHHRGGTSYFFLCWKLPFLRIFFRLPVVE